MSIKSSDYLSKLLIKSFKAAY